jgi:esterase
MIRAKKIPCWEEEMSSARPIRRLLVALSLLGGAVTLLGAAWPLPPGVKSLKVNGYDLAYVEQGSGEPMILIHGASTDLRSFELQMAPLSAKYRVIAISLRHYWPEPWNGEGEFSARQQADDVAAFITALGAGKVHLVGHSRGGYIALDVARSHPELLRDLVLAEPALLLPGLVEGAAKGNEVNAARNTRIETTNRLIHENKLDEATEVWVDGINGKGTYRSRTPDLQAMSRDNIRTVLGEEHENKATITCADAQKISLPVLLIRGEKGSPPTHLALDVLEKCFPDQRHMMIPGAPHGMNRSDPEIFNRAVLEFIAGR